MNKKIKFAAVTLLLAATLAPAQENEKKKKSRAQPKLAVVEMQAGPPNAPVPQPAKPANGSLFTDPAANGGLFRDFKARQAGDLVFVDVVEESSAAVTSGASRKRDSGTVGGVVAAAGALPVPGAAVAGSVIGALGQRKFEGNGETRRESEVRARIAARVVEVLPNGDLRVEGLKLVRLNKETEQVAITGIVRTSDLAADNSVPTIYVGDLRVELNGKGIASADNAPGWLFRLFDKVSPF